MYFTRSLTRLYIHDRGNPQNKSSCRSTPSVTFTVVRTLRPFAGTTLHRPRSPDSYSSSSSRSVTTLFVPLLPLNRPSRRSNFLARSLGAPGSICGRYARPQSSSVRRGRRLGRQADTTPIDGSAAVQRAGWTKLPRNIIKKVFCGCIWLDAHM